MFLQELVFTLNKHELVTLATSLGEKLSKPIRDDAEKMTSKYYNLEELCNYNINDFIQNSNGVLRAFITACCNIERRERKEKYYLIARVIEMMYRLCYPWIVYPLAFIQNLCTYVSTRSRYAVDLSTPLGGGSYDTILKWLVGQGAITGPIKCPDGNIGVAFDNIQVLKKTYAISVNSKMESSVITNIIWITLNHNQCLQHDPAYIPKPWMLELETIRKVQLFEDPLFKKLDIEHYNQLYYALTAILSDVLSEQKLDDTGKYVDLIDEKIKREEKSVKCFTCSEKGIVMYYSKSKRICDICKGSLKKRNAPEIAENVSSGTKRLNTTIKKVSTNSDGDDTTKKPTFRYEHITTHHPEKPPEVFIGEPIFCNPCSFANCTHVLRKIGCDAGIIRYGGKKRYWLIVCCDGLPFRLCNIIIHETFTCTICHSSHFRLDNYKKHCKETHAGQVVEYYFEFDWVLLKPGGGHFEMNSIKSFVELNWVPLFSRLSELLGFKSEKAKFIAKACRDHHKAWQMILMFYFGSLKELCTIYVRDFLNQTRHHRDGQDKSLSSPEGFFEYCKAKTNSPNFMYLLNQVTLYAQAIVNYRMALRRNNSDLALSAIYKLSSLFHGRNHPFYQQIELYSLVQSLLQPTEIKALHDEHYTISLSGDPSKGEDWDFVLENKNKIVKSWIPKGGCKDSYWLTGCRNAVSLERIKTACHGFFKPENVTVENPSYRDTDVSKEIDEWRVTIRRTDYLNKDTFCGISDEILDPDLVNFTARALSKRVSRIDAEYLGKEVDLSYCDPVFITQDERNRYSQKNVSVIKGQILDNISSIVSPAVSNHFKRVLKDVEKSGPAQLLKFNSEIMNYLSEESMC